MAGHEGPGGLTVGFRAMLGQLRANPSVIVTIFVAVAITALFLAATPRLLTQISSDALIDAVSTPPAPQRNIAVGQAARIGASTLDSPFAKVEITGDHFEEQEIPASVQSVIVDRTFVADTPQFGVFPMPGTVAPARGRTESRGSASVCAVCSDELPDEGPFPQFLRLRYQKDIEDHVTLLEGDLPGSRDPIPLLVGSECPDESQDPEEYVESIEVDCTLEAVPVFEVAMTADTLSVLSFGVGKMVVLKPDVDDSLFSSIGLDELNRQLILSVSGVIHLTDSEADFWYGDTRLHSASIAENPDFRIIFATGLMNAGDYQSLLRDIGLVPWRYTWRFFVDPDLIASAPIDVLSADLRNLELAFSGLGSRATGYSVVTQLPTLIDSYLAERAVTLALMSMAIAGVFVVAIAVILELAGLAAMRQRAPIVLIRNRGSSRGQLTLTRTYQGLLLTVPAAALGYFLAERLIPDTDYLVSYRSTVALAVAATSAFVVASIPLIRRPLGSLQREDRIPVRTSGKRLVLDVLVVVIALGSVVVLRRRGLITPSPPDLLKIDPLLALTPALLGVAVGIITLRVYPYLIRAAAWPVSKGRSLVAFVGLRRILQQPPAARLPLVVIIIAVAIAVFSSAVRISINVGQEAWAWQEVAADYSVAGTGPGAALPNGLDLSSVDSIEMTASAVRYPDARILTENQAGLVEFLALETSAYSEVIRGTKGDPNLPDFMFAKPSPGVGSMNSPIPVVISTGGWPLGRAPILGNSYTVDLGRLKPFVVVEEVRDSFPGLPLDRPFVVADLASIDMFSDPVGVNRTLLYARADESAGAEIALAVTEQSPNLRLSSRYKTLSSVAGSPLAVAVDQGLAITFVLTVAFAIVAAISSLALSSSVRRRDLGLLRTLGLEPSQATQLTVIEQIPLLGTATLVGSLLGVAIVIILQPAINLEAFTAGFVSSTTRFDWVAVTVVSVVLLAAVTISVVIFVLANRGEDLGKLLKVGEE